VEELASLPTIGPETAKSLKRQVEEGGWRSGT